MKKPNLTPNNNEGELDEFDGSKLLENCITDLSSFSEMPQEDNFVELSSSQIKPDDTIMDEDEIDEGMRNKEYNIHELDQKSWLELLEEPTTPSEHSNAELDTDESTTIAEIKEHIEDESGRDESEIKVIEMNNHQSIRVYTDEEIFTSDQLARQYISPSHLSLTNTTSRLKKRRSIHKLRSH
ncbi:MAG: hypothetical protein ACMUJM_25530 [bacterium]